MTLRPRNSPRPTSRNAMQREGWSVRGEAEEGEALLSYWVRTGFLRDAASSRALLSEYHFDRLGCREKSKPSLQHGVCPCTGDSTEPPHTVVHPTCFLGQADRARPLPPHCPSGGSQNLLGTRTQAANTLSVGSPYLLASPGTGAAPAASAESLMDNYSESSQPRQPAAASLLGQ